MNEKGKFDKLNWLLFTQIYEVYSSITDEHRARELADLIGIAIDSIRSMGFDPSDVVYHRNIDRLRRIEAIVQSYDRAYREVRG